MNSLRHILKPDEQLFFLHIPKTGGLSLRSYLEAQFTQSEVFSKEKERVHFLKEHSVQALSSYKLLCGHFTYADGQLLPKQPVYITMLREPIERLLSNYEFSKRRAEDGYKADLTVVAENMEIAASYEFGEWIHETIDNPITRLLSDDTLNTSLFDRSNREFHLNLELAKERLSQFAFVGLTEKFLLSMQLLSYTFAWPPHKKVIRINTTQRRLHSENLSESVLNMARKIHRYDLELYSYATKLFNDRFGVMLEDLLDENYLTFNPNLQQMQTNVDFSFEQAVPGQNWYPAEIAKQDLIGRWTGPGKVSTFDARLQPGTDYLLRFAISYTLHRPNIKNLKLRINGKSSQWKKLPIFDLHVYEAVIDHSLVDEGDGLIRLAFEVEQVSEHNERLIGVSFVWLKISPKRVY